MSQLVLQLALGLPQLLPALPYWLASPQTCLTCQTGWRRNHHSLAVQAGQQQHQQQWQLQQAPPQLQQMPPQLGCCLLARMLLVHPVQPAAWLLLLPSTWRPWLQPPAQQPQPSWLRLLVCYCHHRLSHVGTNQT